MSDARELLARMVFCDLKPSPRADTSDMLTIAFRHDGMIVIAAGTDEPVRLAQFLRDLLAGLVEHPAIIEEAAGIRGAAFHLTGEPLHRVPDIPEDDG